MMFGPYVEDFRGGGEADVIGSAGRPEVVVGEGIWRVNSRNISRAMARLSI